MRTLWIVTSTMARPPSLLDRSSECLTHLLYTYQGVRRKWLASIFSPSRVAFRNTLAACLALYPLSIAKWCHYSKSLRHKYHVKKYSEYTFEKKLEKP